MGAGASISNDSDVSIIVTDFMDVRINAVVNNIDNTNSDNNYNNKYNNEDKSCLLNENKRTKHILFEIEKENDVIPKIINYKKITAARVKYNDNDNIIINDNIINSVNNSSSKMLSLSQKGRSVKSLSSKRSVRDLAMHIHSIQENKYISQDSIMFPKKTSVTSFNTNNSSDADINNSNYSGNSNKSNNTNKSSNSNKSNNSNNKIKTEVRKTQLGLGLGIKIFYLFQF
jgi:hypothetical protein